MECMRVREELSALLDGELSPEVRQEVEAHLGECTECLREADALKRVDTAYRALPSLSVPEDFEEGVRAALTPEVVTFPERRFGRLRLWPVLACAAMALVFVSVVVSRMMPSPGRMELAKETAESTVADRAVESKARETLGSEAMRSDAASVADSGASGGVGGKVAAKDDKDGKKKERFGAGLSKEGVDVVERPSEPSATAVAASAAPAPVAAPAAAPMVAAAPVRQIGEEAGSPVGAQELSKRTEKGVAVKMDEAVSASPKMVLPAPEEGAGGAIGERSSDTPAAPAKAKSSAKAESVKAESVKAEVSKDGGKEGESITVAGKVFEFRGGVWRQNGYGDEACTRLARDSEALRAFLAQHPEVSAFCALRPGVLFKVGKVWYRVD